MNDLTENYIKIPQAQVINWLKCKYPDWITIIFWTIKQEIQEPRLGRIELKYPEAFQNKNELIYLQNKRRLSLIHCWIRDDEEEEPFYVFQIWGVCIYNLHVCVYNIRERGPVKCVFKFQNGRREVKFVFFFNLILNVLKFHTVRYSVFQIWQRGFRFALQFEISESNIINLFKYYTMIFFFIVILFFTWIFNIYFSLCIEYSIDSKEDNLAI